MPGEGLDQDLARVNQGRHTRQEGRQWNTAESYECGHEPTSGNGSNDPYRTSACPSRVRESRSGVGLARVETRGFAVTTAIHARRRIVVLVGALVAAAAPSGWSPPSADAARRLNWSTCYRDVTVDTGVGYECAQLKVPLDHDRPRGTSIRLSVVRIPAGDPDARIGSIFLNPGGPGGSGVDFALFFGPAAGFVWGQEVADRFDIVGFDPRGIARSTPVRCFGTIDQATEVFAPFAFPLTPEEEAEWIAGDTLLAERCDIRANRVGSHMSTANVARDLDMLRAAAGDDQLTYFGASYGSYLGVTYANLFPDRVRAVIVDGVLDPVAWANVEAEVPFSTRLESGQGAQATLEQVFALCEEAQPGACPLAPDPGDRYAAIADELLTGGPVDVLLPDFPVPFRLTYQDLVGATLGALYDPFSGPFLFQELVAVEGALADAGRLDLPATAAARTATPTSFLRYDNFVESFPAVACSDTNNPTDYAVWSAEGAAADQDSYFGRLWTWASSPCAQWPLDDVDAYEGPWTAATANDVLVIGNLYDPATRYEGANAVRDLLPNSALVTADLPGHVSLGASGCTGFLMGQYLLDPSTAPAIDGAFCPQEFNPFDLAAADGASADPGPGVSAELRQQLLAEIGVR